MKITLIIPAHNESGAISKTVEEASEYMSGRFMSYEIIVVNDGSSDNTAELMRRIEDPAVRFINYAANSGKGYAVSRGVAESTGDVIFFTDAELPFGIEVLGRAAEKLEGRRADLVVGSRRIEKGAMAACTLPARAARKLFMFISRLISGMRYDIFCGFKGFTREAAAELFPHCRETGFAFDYELLGLATAGGLHIAQVPVRYVKASKIKRGWFRRGFVMICDMAAIRRRFDRKKSEK